VSVVIPKLSLVVLVGASGAGKSTFARAHFRPTEIVSSDAFRAMVSDDENALDASEDAFEVLHHVVRTRLRRGLLTVVDATNVQPRARQQLVSLARELHCLPVAIVFDLPIDTLIARTRSRTDRRLRDDVVRGHRSTLRRALGTFGRDGFRYVHVFRSTEEVDAATVERTPLYNDRRDDAGPFDLIGDVHGCREELEQLLERLGYVRDGAGYRHPEGRKAAFVGDLVDRGPDSPGVLRIVMAMVRDGAALCVMGNHDAKLKKHLEGGRVSERHGFDRTLAQLALEPAEFVRDVRTFLGGLVSHYVLDEGRLVVAHAGLAEHLHGRASGEVRRFALYGDTTGEVDEYGLPVRAPWADAYRGRATVVHGHVPVPTAAWVNGTIDLDTGCVFGGSLTALRYPERELVSVPAVAMHYEPIRPIAPAAPARPDGLLDVEDLLFGHGVETRLLGRVAIADAQASQAFESICRFAIDPRWLVYLPPTMAPSEAAADGDSLERPLEALDYFRKQGTTRIVLEEKHMGSRAILVVARTYEAAKARFAADGRRGVVYTRTGRAFFEDRALEAAIVDRTRLALEASGLWDELGTDFVVLDAELLPWSTKAQALLTEQYAPVGAAARAALGHASRLLDDVAARDPSAAALRDRTRARLGRVGRYVDAYRRYCWPVSSVDDLVIAPFHLLASAEKVHDDVDHVTHMTRLSRLAEADPKLFRATRFASIALDEPTSVEQAEAFFASIVEAGGEGMVVKPEGFVERNGNRVVQPALKVRGREYLRIIYGPEYTADEHLTRLRRRSVGKKRALALRESALGLEGLHRFVAGEPLHRVHECVFGVLALEQEAIDPRL